MANKIGRFEILSEITHSEIGAVYKAADPESGQTIALKTIRLQMLEEQADVLMQHILQEAAGTKPLSSHNIAQLIGVEEIEGQCCASEEYVQGNSIATMLARKEGFSIWDLQDIVRQTCQGLDHAHSHNVVHYSLEPAKIMVTWDGTVKVLSFGVSCMGAFTCQSAGKAPDVLHYISPEQLRGDPVDGRPNIFSLGAILYEMATETKAFPGDDADQVRQGNCRSHPPASHRDQPKIHPVLSAVIMKALSKAAVGSLSEWTGTGQRSGSAARKARPRRWLRTGGAADPRIKNAAGSPGRVLLPSRLRLRKEKNRVLQTRSRLLLPARQTMAPALPERPPGNASSPASGKAAAAAAGWESVSAVSTFEAGEGGPKAAHPRTERDGTDDFSGAGQRPG